MVKCLLVTLKRTSGLWLLEINLADKFKIALAGATRTLAGLATPHLRDGLTTFEAFEFASIAKLTRHVRMAD